VVCEELEGDYFQDGQQELVEVGGVHLSLISFEKF
jgi:hypothetical protein